MIDIITTCFYLTIFFFLLKKTLYFSVPHIKRSFIYSAFALKILATLFLLYTYTYYYPVKNESDIYKYFNDGHKLFILLFKNPELFYHFITETANKAELTSLSAIKYWVKPNSYGIFNDNKTIIITNLILEFFSFGKIITQSVLISCISFISIFSIFKTLSPLIPEKNQLLFFILLVCAPSLLLWTSGLLKETLILISISGIITNGIGLFLKGFSIKKSIYLSLFLIGLFISKPYYLFLLFPVVIYLLCYKYLIKKRPIISLIVTYSILILVSFSYIQFKTKQLDDYVKDQKKENTEFKRNSFIYDQNALGNDYNLLEMLRCKQSEYILEAKRLNAKSAFEIKKLNSTLSELGLCLIINFPNALFRPYFSEINSIFNLLSSLENWIFILLLIASFTSRKKITEDQFALILAAIIFALSILLFLGLLIPVTGNMVRYKTVIYPFTLFIICMKIDTPSILHRCKLIVTKND